MLRITTFILLLSCVACDPAALQKILDATSVPLTEQQIGMGLKEALEIGIGKGSETLSAADGYFKSPYKILLPEEAQKVAARLQGIPGFAQLENNIVEKINRGAEDAAAKAKPIFVNAIRQMTFADALNILMGEKDAATKYLNKATYDQLYQAFQPVIIESLDKFNARKVWEDAATAYNKIPLIQQKANPSLDDYVTTEALKGLFSMVAKEELNIRENVTARTTELLRKVFAKQDAPAGGQ